VIAYPYNPLKPGDISDYLKPLTQQVGTDTVSYDTGTDDNPSKPRSSFQLPKVGLASRLMIDVTVDGDYTAGGGSGDVAADGRGPQNLISQLKLSVNGKLAWYNVSGFGTMILNATEDATSFPQDAPGTAYTTAPTDVASDIFAYTVGADGLSKFSLEIPIIVAPDNPLAMLLLNNDNTTVQLDIEWNTFGAFSDLAGGASETADVTVAVTLEYFDAVPIDIFNTFVRPMLNVGHWFSEVEQTVTAKGYGANKVVMDNHDTYLGIFHTLILDGVVDTDDVDSVRLVLNTNQTRFNNSRTRQLKQQRDTWGKDLPIFAWDMFAAGGLPSALNADAYTAVESFIDINTGATLGTDARILTIAEKLVALA
jgi:hypothetical protein